MPTSLENDTIDEYDWRCRGRISVQFVDMTCVPRQTAVLNAEQCLQHQYRYKRETTPISLLLCVMTPFVLHPWPITDRYPRYHMELFLFPWRSWRVSPQILYGIPIVVIVVFSILPICWVVDKLRQLNMKKRRSMGLCGHCGYDLRATPDRCPECGKVRAGAKL